MSLLIERLKLEREVYRRIGEESDKEAELTRQLMPGSHYINVGKRIICESIVNTLEQIILREEGK